jgi:hypothetical protein
MTRAASDSAADRGRELRELKAMLAKSAIFVGLAVASKPGHAINRGDRACYGTKPGEFGVGLCLTAPAEDAENQRAP